MKYLILFALIFAPLCYGIYWSIKKELDYRGKQ